ARGDARLASRAAVEVDLERVLLARARSLERDEIAVVLCLARDLALVVELREALDRRQAALFLEQRGHGEERQLPFRRRRLGGGRERGVWDARGHDETAPSLPSGRASSRGASVVASMLRSRARSRLRTTECIQARVPSESRNRNAHALDHTPVQRKRYPKTIGQKNPPSPPTTPTSPPTAPT